MYSAMIKKGGGGISYMGIIGGGKTKDKGTPALEEEKVSLQLNSIVWEREKRRTPSGKEGNQQASPETRENSWKKEGD